MNMSGKKTLLTTEIGKGILATQERARGDTGGWKDKEKEARKERGRLAVVADGTFKFERHRPPFPLKEAAPISANQ